uniref:Uncharacterized protein n=1 Tax=Anopheles farauti TaxID=69004 RepID=A0A182QXG7_9DIPT
MSRVSGDDAGIGAIVSTAACSVGGGGGGGREGGSRCGGGGGGTKIDREKCTDGTGDRGRRKGWHQWQQHGTNEHRQLRTEVRAAPQSLRRVRPTSCHSRDPGPIGDGREKLWLPLLLLLLLAACSGSERWKDVKDDVMGMSVVAVVTVVVVVVVVERARMDRSCGVFRVLVG